MTKQEEIPQILILRLWRGDLSYTDVNESKVKCVKGDVTLVPEGGNKIYNLFEMLKPSLYLDERKSVLIQDFEK